jgi:hypothetical protein
LPLDVGICQPHKLALRPVTGLTEVGDHPGHLSMAAASSDPVVTLADNHAATNVRSGITRSAKWRLRLPRPCEFVAQRCGLSTVRPDVTTCIVMEFR